MEKDFPKTDNYLNKLTLRKKMVLLFVFCVLIPLVVTDGLVIYNVYRIAKITEMKELESDAEAVRYGIQEGLEYPASVIRNIYKNYRVEELLNKKYKSALDYYNEYAVFKKNSLYESMLGNGNESISSALAFCSTEHNNLPPPIAKPSPEPPPEDIEASEA